MSNVSLFFKGVKEAFSPKSFLQGLRELKPFGKFLLPVLLIIQITTFVISKDYTLNGYIALIVGIATIINLSLVNIGHISNYSWGLVSAIFWLYTSLQAGLLSDIATQGFFVVMQFVGIYMWMKAINQKDDNTGTTESKKLSLTTTIVIIVGTIAMYFGLVFVTTKLNGNQVWLDAAILPLNIVGQLLMSYSYRSQWVAWILVNIINIVIWFNQTKTMDTAAISMLVLQVAMLINSFYGAYLWFKESNIESQK